MNVIQLHLMLNHVPVIGMFFALALFLYGFARMNHDFQRFSLGMFVFLALVTIPAFITGDAVEKLVENLPGIADDLVEPHERAATAALVAMEFLGGIALAGIYFFRQRANYPRGYLTLLGGLSLVTMLLMAWTAHTGGHIRHVEMDVASHLIEPAEGHPSYAPSDAREGDR